MRIKEYEDEDGKLIAWAWPGGYPVIYVNRQGDMLCPTCAQKNLDELPKTDHEYPTGVDIYYEGPPLECLCGKFIESAYGDPDERSTL